MSWYLVQSSSTICYLVSPELNLVISRSDSCIFRSPLEIVPYLDSFVANWPSPDTQERRIADILQYPEQILATLDSLDDFIPWLDQHPEYLV